MADDPLAVLVGRQLSSVEFVQDYVQLRFDGPYLTAITLPKVVAEGRSYSWGECSYRDRLCECIAHNVRDAHVQVGHHASVEFDNSTIVSVSLRGEDYLPTSSEALIFFNGPEDTWVW